jgi:TPR repeat protein
MRSFTAAYRCDDCGHRFLATSGYRVFQTVTLGSFAIVLIAASGYGLFSASNTDSHSHSSALRPVHGTDGAAHGAGNTADINEMRMRAARGDPVAQHQLAVALADPRSQNGGDSEMLLVEAVRLLGEAALQGHAPAQTDLAERYLEGKGVVQDFAQATDWYHEAAMQGDRRAMLGLGNMARLGQSNEVSLVEAYAWLNVAAARGEKRAERARRQVMARLSSTELQEAQRLSRTLNEATPLTPRAGKER